MAGLTPEPRANLPPLRARIATALLLARLGCLYAAFTIGKRLVPLPALARRAWRHPDRTNQARCGRVIAGVIRLGRLTGADRGDCLQLALVLYRELSRCGRRPVLVTGLRRDGQRVRGHAWVEVDGVPVADSGENVGQFAPAIAFGERGERVDQRLATERG